MKIPKDMAAKNVDEAIAMKLTAEQMRHNITDQEGRNGKHNEERLMVADALTQASDSYLILGSAPALGVGGELVQPTGTQSAVPCPPLKQVSRINTEASIDRLNLASKNGVLSMALDTADSVNASNAAEKMIAHQMAVAHRTSLDLIAEAANIRDPIEKCRMINMASKLMDTSQKGLLTLHKAQNGGKQTMTIQHIQVDDGGQAIVNGAANMQGGQTK